VGDYDNDGDLDLYLANFSNDGSPNKLFRNDGGGTFVDATSGPLGDTGFGRGVAWGDYDNDGDLDLYLANSGANRLFRNDQATGNHWLAVKLVGTVSNRTGIGARVRVVAGGVSRIQEISGGSVSQNSLAAEFGLGVATTIDSLIVRWPSGIVQRVPGVSVDQMLTIIESSTPTGVEVTTATTRAFLLQRAVPNPFGSMTTISYDLAADSPVSLRVLDITGRLVRQLQGAQFQKAGRYETIWDSRDARGSEVSAGVYFYQLKAGSFQDTKRLVLVRSPPLRHSAARRISVSRSRRARTWS
jgi:enediyne biosynthesis protein E4